MRPADAEKAMRLLFITRKFPPSVGGMEVYSLELDRAIRGMGVDIDLHAPRTPILGRPSLWQIVRFFIGACLHVVRRGRRYDAILIGDFAIASVACIARLFTATTTRIGVSLHGQDLYFMRRNSMAARLYRAIGWLVLRSGSLDVAIANSAAIRQEALARGFRRVAVVPLATSPTDVAGVGRADPSRLVFAGRLIRYKGLSWFVEHVWPHLDPRLELHVAGEVWDEEDRRCLDGDPRIHYLGKVDHAALPALRASAIACIMPNRPPAAGEQDEGFGLSALESAAAGTPIVAARTGGLPDAVVEGVTGFLVDPLDAAGWIARLSDITTWSDAQRERFSAGARDEIRRNYNWPLVARRTVALLDPANPLPGTADSRPGTT